MKKRTHFFSKLLINADIFQKFNTGLDKNDIANNRKDMLQEAGVEYTEEIISMSTHELQKFMEKELFPKLDETLNATICGLIMKQRLTNPAHIAIIDGHTSVDYQELMKRASEVAGELKSRQVTKGSLVGVCMSRTWELVATLIGVMQAGCAYVPLDPGYPQERVQYMLEHSRAVAAIVDTDKAAALCKGVRELVWIDAVGNHSDVTMYPSANELAYVIYTSGSTGRPKGVAVEHKSVVAMRTSMREKFSDEDLKGVFAGASVCFDTSVMEIMGTLSLGGTLILAKNALELTTLPAVDKLTLVVIVASALQALLTTQTLPKGLRCLVFGGEALKRSLVDQVYALAPNLRVFNAYGPTEDTVYSTLAEVPSGVKTVTIGKSVPDSTAYILDDTMQPVSMGEAGELYLAGSKLARGYLYDEVLTKERFIEIVPSEILPENRLYKTGDLCRWTENEEIEFLGRIDQQVKIRGFRIELEEIESTLESMKGVDAAAAVAIDGGIGQKILAVYITTRDESVTEVKVKSYLSARLPKYMVPQVVRYLKELPFLPNDKLDRKKLLSLENDIKLVQDAAIAVSSKHKNNTSMVTDLMVNSNKDRQAILLSIIQHELVSILNLNKPVQVLPNDSFDNLGLDSLSTLEFSSRLSKVLGYDLSAYAIFEHSTPQLLVNYIITTIEGGTDNALTHKQPAKARETLASFQTNIQSSHPTFQAANAPSWSANDKSKLVQEFMQMVNDNRRNPYGKVLRTGSAARGIIGDSYNNEEQEAIIWSTNLYFGLNRDPEVIQEASDALARYGTGMGISAAATGMTTQHLEFEKEFADLVGKPSACLFPTGYTANLGAISGLLGQNDVVVIDQLCHASIVDGARLSGAKIRTFKHNDASDLATVLESEVSPYRTVLVVLESVYSMGEGTAPVAEIVHTAKKYDALVLVDEAHSFGFYGTDGAGVCAAQGVTDEVDFIMTTLSKALGSIGGVIAASQQHIDLLKSSSRAYIFQASISPADIAAGLTSLRRLRSDDVLRNQLWEMTRYMRKRFEEAGYDLGTGDGPIITPHFGDKDKLYAIVQSLYKRGVQTLAVTYPIVEIGRGRLRFICSASHTYAEVDKTVEALIEAEREVDLQLAQKKIDSKDVNIKNEELVDWADKFADYLKKSIAETTVSTPNLAISVSVSEQSEPILVLVKDGQVILNEEKSCDLPYCSILLTDRNSVTALQSCDVQGLLNSICDGNCLLKGQVEPFIWLIGRMVEQRESTFASLV
ncbi:amino acid adenylation domain-containing protein [Aquimarina sp. W85]|uniref:amino acid adenylation domain-containing protein n=1 Tax=Aquimarina rhodophyticola TaxID=3342246 RepID=UPI0036707D96